MSAVPPPARGRHAVLWGCVAAGVVFLSLCYEAKDVVLERIFLKQLASKDGLQQRKAARELVRLTSMKAVEPLVELIRAEAGGLRREDDRTWIPRALLGLGTAGLDAALAACQGPDDVRWLLHHGTEGGGAPATELLPHLTRCLERSEHRDVLMEAVDSLGGLDSPLLLEKLEDPDPWWRAQAARGLANVTAPVPGLLERLVALTQDAEPEVRAAAVGAIARRPGGARLPEEELRALLSRGLEDPAKGVRTATCEALAQAEPAARPDWERMLRLLGQPEAAEQGALSRVVQAYGSQGIQILPALDEVSFHAQPQVRAQTLLLLQAFFRTDRSETWLAYIRLAESLDDIEPGCRHVAQFFFSRGGMRLGSPGPAAVPGELIDRALKLLRSSDALAHVVAMYFVAVCAPDRRVELVEPLLPLLREQSYSIRSCAFSAIRNFSWKDPRILETLLRMTAESDAPWQSDAAWLLEWLVPGSESLTRVLLEQLERGEKSRHFNAAGFSIFAKRRELPGAAVPHVLRALETNDYVLVWPAMELVHLLGARAQEAAVLLVRLLPEEEPRIVDFSGRLQPSEALVRLGPAAVPALLDGLKAPEPKVRRLSLLCVVSIARKHPELVQPGATNDAIASGLRRLRDDPDPHIRIDALEACALLPGDVQPAIAALEPFLAQADEGLCGGALGALGSIARSEPRALAIIAGALQHPSRHARRVALLQLTELGPTAASALPRLRESLEYEDSELRQLARKAIAKIEAPPVPPKKETP